MTKETKTKAGMREVKLLDPTQEEIEAPMEYSLLPGGRIFTNPVTRKPWNDDTVILKHWQTVLHRAGIATEIPIRRAIPM